MNRAHSIPGVRLPEHRALIVVAVRVESGTDPRIVGTMSLAATTRDDMPTDGQAAGVHRPERGCGEGEEHPRVLNHTGGHVFGVVSGEPGAKGWKASAA